MSNEAVQTTRKPQVIQLTALLDLLFIMIFISLLMKEDNDEKPVPNHEPVVTTNPVSTDEKEKARLELLEEAARLQDAETAGLGVGLKKLFIANTYYEDGRRREYHDTSLWAADGEAGVLRFRLKLAQGTAVIGTNVKTPLQLAADDPITDCSLVQVTRERIYQHCATAFGRQTIIDCRRKGAQAYKCDESLSQTQNGRTRDWRWNYDLELISSYDGRFAD